MKRNPTYQDIQDMKYLELVIKETQRLYPSVPFIGRECTESMYIDKNLIPKGTALLVFIMGMGYNEKYFSDPYKVDPDRFSAENLDKRLSAFDYIPFSAGPRNCIGQKFAMLEMKSVISKVIRNFIITPPIDDLISKDGYERWEQTEYDPKLSSLLTLKSDNGILIRLKRREDF